MEAGLMKRILMSGNGVSYKIFNIYFAPNCPGRIVAPNCPRRIVLRRIVRAELSAPNCPAPNCPGTAVTFVAWQRSSAPVPQPCFILPQRKFSKAPDLPIWTAFT